MPDFRSTKEFERLCFDAEAFLQAQSAGSTKYLLVINQERLLTALGPAFTLKWALEPEEIVEEKKPKKEGDEPEIKIDRPRERAKRRIDTLQGEIRRQLRANAGLTIEQIGQNHRYGLVDLLSIPVLDEAAVSGTLLEGQTCLKILRIVKPGKLKDYKKRFSRFDFKPYLHQTETLTGLDLENICAHTEERRIENPALVGLKDIFIESYEGSNIAGALNFLRERATAQSLSILRQSAEEVFRTNSQMIQGDKFEEVEGRNYVELLRELGHISSSDYPQAKAMMFAGHKAVHGEHTAFHSLNALLFYSWITDYVDRTVGMHRLTKSKVNGTSLNMPYNQELDEERHGFTRAIFDQFQAMRATEPAGKYEGGLLAGDRTVSKVDAMTNAMQLLEYVKPLIDDLCMSDQKFCEVMSFWRGRHEKKKYAEYSSEDALRANLFVFGICYKAHRQEPSRLELKVPGDRGDNNLFVAIRRKAAGPTFYSEVFRDLEPALNSQLTMAKEIAEAYLATLVGIELK